MARPFRYSETELREAVAASVSYAEVLRRLGLRTAGGNHAAVRKYVDDVYRTRPTTSTHRRLAAAPVAGALCRWPTSWFRARRITVGT